MECQGLVQISCDRGRCDQTVLEEEWSGFVQRGHDNNPISLTSLARG